MESEEDKTIDLSYQLVKKPQEEKREKSFLDISGLGKWEKSSFLYWDQSDSLEYFLKEASTPIYNLKSKPKTRKYKIDESLRKHINRSELSQTHINIGPSSRQHLSK